MFLSLLAPLPPLEIRATDLRRALPVIGARYGRTMKVAPAIEDAIVVAHLEDASLEEVEAHLATEFGGEWKTSSDGMLTFAPSARLRAAQERDLLARHREAARGELARNRERAEHAQPMTATAARQLTEWAKQWEAAEEKGEDGPERPNIEVPSDRFLLAVLAALGPDAVAGPLGPSRSVFSPSPTAMQLGLPPAASGAFARYVRAQALLDAERAPASFYLIRQGSYDQSSWSLVVFDAKGEVVDTQEFAVSFSHRHDDNLDEGGGATAVSAAPAVSAAEVTSAPSRPQTEPPASPTANPKEPPIPYSLKEFPERVAERKLFDFESLMTGSAEVDRLLRVGEREPLAGIPSEMLLSAARLGKRNLVATVPDLALGWISSPDEGDLRSTIRPESVEIAPRWLTVRGADPCVSRAMFFPRRTLQRAIDLVGGQRPSLRIQREIAPLLPDFDEPPFLGFLMLASRTQWMPEVPALRFFATVDDATLRAATSEEGVPISSLNAAARARAADLLFSGVLSPTKLMNPNARTALVTEPTFAMPNGVPGNARLFAQQEGQRQYRVKRSRFEGYETVGLPMLAYASVDAGRAGRQYDFSRIAIVNIENLELRLQPNPETMWGGALIGGETVEDAGPYTLTTLPEKDRAELAEMVAQISERRRGTPPPQ